MKQLASADISRTGLPADPDGEKLFLGALMLNPEDAGLALSWLADDDYATEDHRRISSAARTVFEGGGTPDRVSVYYQLQKRGHAISLNYLVSLDDGLPKIYGLEGYAERIRGLATRRRLILAGQAIQEAALLDDTTSPSDMLEQAGRTIATLAEGSSRQAQLKSAAEWFELCGMEKILMPAATERGGVRIPWANVAQLLPNLRAGQLIVPAARPGLGKTALAAQIGANAAQEGCGVAYFSLEMSAAEILQRLACGHANIDAHKARLGKLDLHERADLQEAATALAALPLYIDDTTGATVGAVSAAVRALNARRPVGLVVIDYLQLMSAPGRSENRNVEVSEISRGLKRLARELKIPVLACSQINRDSERQGRRPTLADLRDSGSIEQDADVVLFLHQVSRETDSPIVETEILIAKHRGGPTGKRVLGFNRALTLFQGMTV